MPVGRLRYGRPVGQPPRPVAIGARDHSGWAVLVTVAMTDGTTTLEVLDRRRVGLVDPDLPRQPYHAAAGKPLNEAAALIEAVERSARTEAESALAPLLSNLGDDRREVVGMAVAADTTAVPDSLETVLGSHPLLHAGEGALYRDALVDAAHAAGLPVTRSLTKTVTRDSAAALGLAPAELGARLDGQRVRLGAPWQKDHKEAAAAALLVLASA